MFLTTENPTVDIFGHALAGLSASAIFAACVVTRVQADVVDIFLSNFLLE